ncbi:MAG: hypothetical protein HOE02_05570 [Candidatus Marinimicrobia bacterium]|jgi:hypothetical protein|nr:hypothetical protein [Candidatus Neomarinimicrobiota bacterium]
MKIKLNSGKSFDTKFYDNTGRDITAQLNIVSATIKIKASGKRPTVDLVCLVDKIDLSEINISKLIDSETKNNKLQPDCNICELCRKKIKNYKSCWGCGKVLSIQV